MQVAGQTEIVKSGSWLGFWRIAGLLLVVFIIAQSGLYMYGASVPTDWDSNLGISGFAADCAPDHYCRLKGVRPGSPAQQAGLIAGDAVRFDRFEDGWRLHKSGEVIGVTAKRGDQIRHLSLTTVTRQVPALPSYIVESVIGIIAALAGGLLLLRGPRSASVLLISLAYACYSCPGTYPRLWQNAPLLFPFFVILLNAIYFASPLCFIAAARAFRQDMTGRKTPLLGIVQGVFAALLIALVGAQIGCELDATSLPMIGNGFQAANIPLFIAMPLTLAIFLLGWKDVPRDQRRRYAFMIAAICLTMMAPLLDGIITNTSNDYTHFSPLLIGWMVCWLGGTLLFAYAILRHRVIDIGFAVNQTLIYGVLSFLILLLFGLAEWGIEKIMPEAWRAHMEANGLISAGIALVIFLVFHRIRDGVEHVIEGVFFHKWRANEAKLNRFVRQAAHMLKPGALKAAAVAEFVRFSGGAQVALYSSDGARLVRAAGELTGLEAALDADLTPLVEMRAEGRPLFDDAAAPLHAALVLPMIQRNDLTGFIALGPKPSGDAYRPDERAALADAAQKAGLDLHALRIEELETEAAAQRQRADLLQDQLQLSLKA